MQDDGNLVLYSANNEAVWASDTYGNERAYLVVQDDRNVVIYSADGTSIWATNTTA
jgi:outer membrane protein assembly factor BamB